MVGDGSSRRNIISPIMRIVVTVPNILIAFLLLRIFFILFLTLDFDGRKDCFCFFLGMIW